VRAPARFSNMQNYSMMLCSIFLIKQRSRLPDCLEGTRDVHCLGCCCWNRSVTHSFQQGAALK
jgi:hypothetical protein